MPTRARTLAAAVALMMSSAPAHATPEGDAPAHECEALYARILGSSDTLRGIAAEPERYRLQILLAEVVEREDGPPTLRRYPYREHAEYFYPASTVKLVAAAAALDALERLAEDAPWLSPDTPVTYHALFDGERDEAADDSNIDSGRITIRSDVRRALIVSDNPAYNRLFELVGAAELNRWARGVGLASAHVVHRLAERRTSEENRTSPAITLSDGERTLSIPRRVCPPTAVPAILETLPGHPDFPLGRAHVDGAGRIVGEPMRFAGKNLITLRDLQTLTAMILRPDLDLGGADLGLAAEHRELLVRAMTDDPSESRSPRFDPVAHSDDWPHFFRRGIERVVARPDLRVGNKIGLAYGFVSETAYVEHVASGRAFLLAACVYTNDNATLNDSVYEYDLAFRVMEDIAEACARHVLGDHAVARPGERSEDGTLVPAPSPWLHERRQVVGAGGEAVLLAPGAVWTGPPIRPDRPFTEAIVSWNVDLAEGAGARLEIRTSADGEAWSEWLSIGECGGEPPDDPWVVRAGATHVDIDTLVAERARVWLQLRARASAGGAAPIVLRRLDVCTSARTTHPPRVRDERRAGPVVTATPYRENTNADPARASRLCSPLSLRMLLAQRGADHTLDRVADAAYDPRFDIYGNWTRNIQAAYELGTPGYLTRFGDWASVREHLETVGPLAISLRFEEGEVANAPYGTAGGHIIVLHGLDERGDALVLDPALSPESEARRTYGRDELSEAWLRRVKGLAYALLPPERQGATP